MTISHLSTRELGERWNISPRTLERWRWVGEGPRFLKLGGRVVYRLADIEAFEAAHLRTRTDLSENVVVQQEPPCWLKQKQNSTRKYARKRANALQYAKIGANAQ